MAKATQSEPQLIKSQSDSFNGFVEMFFDESKGYYIRQTRKDYTSDYYATDELASVEYNKLVEDTMF